MCGKRQPLAIQVARLFVGSLFNVHPGLITPVHEYGGVPSFSGGSITFGGAPSPILRNKGFIHPVSTGPFAPSAGGRLPLRRPRAGLAGLGCGPRAGGGADVPRRSGENGGRVGDLSSSNAIFRGSLPDFLDTFSPSSMFINSVNHLILNSARNCSELLIKSFWWVGGAPPLGLTVKPEKNICGF